MCHPPINLPTPAGSGVWWLPCHPELERGLAPQDSQTAAPTTRPHFLPVATAMQREYKMYTATAVVRKKRERKGRHYCSKVQNKI